jgi:hypothetical protein
VRTVARPTWRGNNEQRELLKAVNDAIDHKADVIEQADAAIWEAARKARDAGVPDTQLCRITGLNRSTLQRKLGPRLSESDNASPAE